VKLESPLKAKLLQILIPAEHLNRKFLIKKLAAAITASIKSSCEILQ
jgi:hypothetical protein